MILGQVDLVGSIETALYAPAASTKGTIKVIVANRNPATVIAQIRVVHRPGVGPTAGEDYLAFDEAIPGNESRVSAVFDVTNPEEVLVRSSVSGVTAQANGIER